jgi:hypothetical protein
MYSQDLDGYQCLLGDITLPPQIMYMHLDILNDGHAFGATLFKVLRMCSGLRRLSFEFYTNSDLEVKLHLFIHIYIFRFVLISELSSLILFVVLLLKLRASLVFNI